MTLSLFPAPVAADPFPGVAERFDAMRPVGGFRVIYADPPWLYKMRSAKGEGRAPQAHYDCLSVADICTLPVWRLAATDAVLVMWTVWPFLEDAFKIVRAWGFIPNTGGAWAKESKNSGTLDPDAGECHAFHMGTGYFFRSACEPLLVGTRGEPKYKTDSGARGVRNLFYDPVREHSRKPDSVWRAIETRTPGPYVELFARHARPGWACWGDEIEEAPTA